VPASLTVSSAAGPGAAGHAHRAAGHAHPAAPVARPVRRRPHRTRRRPAGVGRRRWPGVPPGHRERGRYARQAVHRPARNRPVHGGRRPAGPGVSSGQRPGRWIGQGTATVAPRSRARYIPP